MRQDTELVEDIYTAIGRGDMPTVLGMMSDDVHVEVPGRLREFHQTDAIAAAYR